MSKSGKLTGKPKSTPRVNRRFLVILVGLLLFLIVNLGFLIYLLSDNPSGIIYLELTSTHMMPNPTVEALLHQTETATATIAEMMTETAEAQSPQKLTATQAEPCAWMWATQFNPELSETLQAEFEDDDHVSLVQAESFGENCLNADGSIRYFAAMQTDFRIFMVIDVPRHDIATAQTALEPLVLDALSILTDYPPDQTPGPNPGRITFEIRVRNGPTDGGYLMQVDYTQAMDALERDLSGAALFEALGGLIERPSMAAT